MNPGLFRALLIVTVVLAAPMSACRKGGGGSPPCRDQSSSVLRSGDGTPAGRLNVAVGAEALTVEFLPADGRRFGGAYLIGTPDAESRLLPDDPEGGRVVIPWEGIADDVCGQTLTLGVESLPTETVTLTVACPTAASKTSYATDTGGGGGGGGYCQP